ncbi:peptide deformylase [Limihaloglobus sulfuriphilus]|nr:peptide deformylase [Limihaloglobus sulfuriphilus]
MNSIKQSINTKKMQKIDIDKCKLTFWPADVLKKPAEPVEEINENIRSFVSKMIEIMIESKGIGLAAPQAGVGLNIFVVSLEGTAEDARVFINPELKPFGKTTAMQEGCLSFPGMYPTIRRPSHVKVTALDVEGNEFTEEADGLYAKCLQHEYDHLQGTTIAQRMGKLGRIKFRDRLNELEEKYGGDAQ